MIKEYIDSVLPNIDAYSTQEGLRGAINSCVLASIISWREPTTIRPDGTLRGLVDYCVNIYMTGLTKEARQARKNTATGISANDTGDGTSTRGAGYKSSKGDKIRLKGTITVVSISPPSGQIENGKIVSFVSVHELYKGDKWPYTYNAITGIYTVYTNSRGRVRPYPRRVLDGTQISEQYGKLFFSQLPTVTAATSMVVQDVKHEMQNTSEDVAFRYDSNLAGYIKDKKYYEFRTEMVGDPPVETTIITKTLDLASYMPTVGTEKITIGKLLIIDNVLCVLFFTDKGYPTQFPADDDIDLGRMYNRRAGEATIKGNVLLIDRATWEISKPFNYAYTSAVEQIRFTGVIDMLVDDLTGRLVLAELSEASISTTMTYDTAKITVLAADRRTVHTDVTKYTEASWYSWLSQENYNYGFPTAVHVIKEGTKTWDLKFPKLYVRSYKLTPAIQPVTPGGLITPPVLTDSKLVYEDSTTVITTKHDKTCVGGYVNCMLYQDIYDAKKPIYIGRCYDAWTQIPFISDDYTIVSGTGPWGNFRADKGKYLNSPLPGEISGFFGVMYHKIIDTLTLALVADVPGDHCSTRSFMKDDTSAYHYSISGAQASTDITLLAINDYVSTPYIQKVRENSIFNTFSAGPGVTDIDRPTVRHSGSGFQSVYAAGLHTYSTRFVLINAKDTPDIKLLLLAGSFEYQTNVYKSGEQANTHHSTNLKPYVASTGFYMVGAKDETTGVYQLADVGTNWTSYYVDNSGITSPAWQPFMQYRVDHFTITVSRADIKLLGPDSFYLVKSILTRQYDYFQIGISNYVSGLLWWICDRQAWQYTPTAWKGVLADMSVNLNGEDRQGAETLLLQVY